MARSCCFALLLLIAHLGNVFVVAQSTIGDGDSDEQIIVESLNSFVRDFLMQNSDAWSASTRAIQSEFQHVKDLISRQEDRMERHDTYLKNSIEEIKNEAQTASNDIKAQISRLFTFNNNSIEEIKIQVETGNNDIKRQISRLENRVERHDTYMNNLIEELTREIQIASNDTNAKISLFEDRSTRQDTYMNNSIEEVRRQVETRNNDIKRQISRLENRVERHDAYMNNSLQENRRQMQTSNNDIKVKISLLESSVEHHDANISNSLQENKRQVDALKNDIKSQISRLDNRVERHENTSQENKRQMQLSNVEIKNEIEELNRKMSSRNCPSGFDYGVAGYSKCYAVLTDRVNWSTAQQRCRQLNTNAQLAVIINSREVQITSEIIQSRDCSQQNEGDVVNEFWIGARRRMVSNCSTPIEWTSNNGAQIPIQSGNWAPQEPNCGRENESCASIDKLRGSKWNDMMCTWRACPLCEVTIEN